MRKHLKKSFSLLLTLVLSLSFFTGVSASTDLTLGNNVNSGSIIELNPNAIVDKEYVLWYDDETGESWTEELNEELRGKLESGDYHLNSKLPNGINYSIRLQPISGASSINVMISIHSFIGSKPPRLDITTVLQRSVTRYGSTNNVGTSCTVSLVGINVKVGIHECEKSISSTGFYTGKVTLEVKQLNGILLGTESSNTSTVLTNKRATEYPYYVDQWSGKVMTEPARADWTTVPLDERVIWNNTTRGNYISQYSVLYPNNGWNWDGYFTHIHHIKPRAYGGTNDFNNLIPLPASYHNTVVTPWWNSY